jgi:predicted regulator of Ras-like GTPase activity (Roadblock/LC7/MglB family)/predicted ArsR family transcriptional regulator
LDLLKTLPLTSDEIADKLMLNKQDARTYLLRLRHEGKIKTLGKRGRNYIYTFNAPIATRKTQIDTNTLVDILKDYLESAPTFKTEINKKIAKLEAKLNTIAAQTQEYLINDDVIKISSIRNIEEELEMLHHIEDSDTQMVKTPELLTRQSFEPSVLENLDNILVNLIDTVPEVKAATIVSIEGEILTSALPQDVDEMTIAVMTAALLSLAESAITLIKNGDFEQLFIQGGIGYLLVLPAGLNAVLAVSTSRNVKLGLTYHDCKQVSEQIAKLI